MTTDAKKESIPLPEEPVTVETLEIVNYRRNSKVDVTIAEKGLTLFYGMCISGKTSGIQGLAHIIGGPDAVEAFDRCIKDGSEVIPGSNGAMSIGRVTCHNGMKIERKFTLKNPRVGNVSFIFPDGTKAGQTDLNRIWDKVSLHPKAMGPMSERDRLKYVKDGLVNTNPDIVMKFDAADALYVAAEARKAQAYQDKEHAQKHANELDHFPEAPTEEVSAAKLIAEQQEIVAHNAKCDTAKQAFEHATAMMSQSHGEAVDKHNAEFDRLSIEAANAQTSVDRSKEDQIACTDAITATKAQLEQLNAQLERQEGALAGADTTWVQAEAGLKVAKKRLDGISRIELSVTPCMASPESQAAVVAAEEAMHAITRKEPGDITEKLAEIESINKMVRSNKMKDERQLAANKRRDDWRKAELEMKAALDAAGKVMEGANLPIDGIGVRRDEKATTITFGGLGWSDLSGVQRLTLEIAVASMYNPHAKLVIIDKLEQMDSKRIKFLHNWAKKLGLQVLGTIVRETEPEELKGEGVLCFEFSDGKCIQGEPAND